MSSNIPLDKQDIPDSQKADSNDEVPLSLTDFTGKKKCDRCLQGFPLDTPFQKAKRVPKHPSESAVVHMCYPCFSHASQKSLARRSQARPTGI